MQGDQPLHRVTIGRTREVRGPDAFERGAVGIIIAVTMTLAVWFGVRQMHMAEAVEAMTLASSVEDEAIVYHAVHGAWPSPGHGALSTREVRGRYVNRTHLGQDGVITMRMTLGLPTWNAAAMERGVWATTTGLLSFRPELLGVAGGQTVMLLCGYARPVEPAAMPRVTNMTTLDRRDLPAMCR